MENPIVFCEPQCFGFEHAPVNAALLGVFQHAFPGRALVFICEEQHGQCVLELCRKNHITLELVIVQPPDRNLSHIKRILPEKKYFAQVITLARQYGCTAVVCTSLTGTGLFLQNKFVKKNSDLKFVNFLHGMLQSLQEKAPWKPWKKWFWFPKVLNDSIHKNILFFVYGESIRRLALKLVPDLADQLLALDHPCFFHPPCKRETEKIIRIGALGIGGRSKGTHLFFALATRFKDEIQAGLLEFIVIGPILDKKIDQIPEYVQVPSPGVPLVRSEYEKMICSIDYALYMYNADAYTLTASGAFMDAISFAKPVIALENPFFKSYFDTFGDIGYLCSTVEDIYRVIQDRIVGDRQQQYPAQVQNLVQSREKISIQALSRELRSSLNGRV